MNCLIRFLVYMVVVVEVRVAEEATVPVVKVEDMVVIVVAKPSHLYSHTQ